MKAIYKLHVGTVDGVDVYQVCDFNPCSVEHVRNDYVKEAVVMLQYILDAESLKGEINDRAPYTMALIEMKKIYELLKGNGNLIIDKLVRDFSIQLAKLSATLDQLPTPEFDRWYKEVLEKIKENNECY